MGTKVDSKSYLPGYYSMRDLNEDSSSSSWPLCYGDKAIPNGPYYNGFMPRTAMEGYAGYGMDALKQRILEHETVFKNQVYELHRLYRIQRDMMEEFRRKEQHKTRASMEPSSSSSRRGSQVPFEEARKWHMAGLPFLNSTYERTSISGVEIANSPMSCTKGNSTQPANFPYQNGSSVKDIELSDSRPLKVRKKLFDLELPADEYIDTEEGQRSPECRASHVSSYAPNGNLKNEPENQKSYPVERTGATTDCRIDVSTSASCFKNSTLLADLNEPIDVEEAIAPSSTDFPGHSSINGQTNGVNYGAKSNAGFLGVNAKKSYYRDDFLINSSVESKVNERGPLSHIYEPGSSKSNLDSVIRGLQDNSHPIQCMPNPHDHPSGMYPGRRNREDLWREENHHNLESSNRSRDQSNNRFLGHHIASHAPGSDQFFSSSYFSGAWTHTMPSWAKPSFTKKITPIDSCLNPASQMDRGLQISAECRESNGGKRRVGDDFRLNPGFGGDRSTQNGFYHGSASGSKKLKAQLPSAGFDYLNCSRGDNLASSDRMINHAFGHFPKGSSFAYSKPAIDINLNDVVSKSSSNEVVILQDAAMVVEKGNPTDHLSTLPWLKNKPVNANGSVNPSSYLQASSSQFSCKTEAVRDLNEPFIPKATPASSDSKAEITRNQNVKKILGFPIFETGGSKNEPLSHVSTLDSFSCPPDRKNVDKKRKNVVIDINQECEPEEQITSEEQDVEKEKQAKSGFVRDLIDLNSCVTDCGDTLAPYESKSANVKVLLEIDLESPLLPEEEEYGNTNIPTKANTAVAVVTDSSQEEALRTAAEVILAMSSSSPKTHVGDSNIDLLEASLEESFLWFVNAVSSCPNELKTASISEELSEEMDDFEAMTLKIPETKEDYMPMPFVPDAEIAEDTGGNTLTRPRRGQSRRGRQRRDFQRDILPGLTSLSRHEVTDDIQIFGGLMRATGHHWLSRLARRNATRNGGGRGRRRAVVVESVPTFNPSPSPNPVCTPLMQQLSNIEAGLEDRSLAGWGKTPRRPRRQRCPAGNPAAVVKT